MNEPFILVLLGVIGVLMHSLYKMKSLQEMSRSANLKFHWYRTYVKKDDIAIILSFLAVLVWYLIYTEAATQYPKISGWRRTTFFCSGFIGSLLIQLGGDAVSNSAKRQIQKFIDIKTNISDVVTGAKPEDSLKEIIKKGEDKTGVDVTIAPKSVDVPINDIKLP